MVAGLPQKAEHSFARPSGLPPSLAVDSDRLLDDSNAASEASSVDVSPQSVCRSFRVVRCTQTEGTGARQPPAQVRVGGRRCPAPNLRHSELA